jgi:hypothetical protein
MDVWAAGLILCELCRHTPPVFKNAGDEMGLMVMVCTMFGSPDTTNDIMPSFNRAKLAGKRLSFLPGSRPVGTTPYDKTWHPGWAYALLRSTLNMEPSRRPSAQACVELLDPSCHGPCPKTPKVATLGRCEVYISALRAMVGDILFETCVPVSFDRRTFHAAARLCDRYCGNISEPEIPVLCAAVSSIASKLCETWGIGPYCVRGGSENAGVGIRRFAIKPEDVEAEELRILEDLEWDAWDVLVIDVPVPANTDPELYAYVCDMMVSQMGTNECTPYEMADVAALITRAMADPRSQKVFPCKLMGVLEVAVDFMNSPVTDRSPVRERHAPICGQIVRGRIHMDFETIKWI